MSQTLDKAYAPHDVQDEIAELWEEHGSFHAVPDQLKDPYVIVIPPPNVTAALHLGHALNNTLQDILVRHHRMRGFNTEWMPGTDHAGIATQTVVEKRVQAEEGKKRTDFERDEFVARIQAWKDEYEAHITKQLVEMGCSCDFDRQRFTMDPVCVAAVREAFFRLFKDGLIYRGKRLVNWDPVTQTALADDEVEMEDVAGHFWYMKYPVVDESGNDTGEFCTVATTRPETMLGDTAVAVNPKDEERAKFIGKSVRLPIINRIIPVIGDDYVVVPNAESDDTKARFASGFLKVTPAHDPNDWEIGQRHDLGIINVMAPDGSISVEHGWEEIDRANADTFLDELIGKDRYEVREAIVAWFKEKGLLADVRDYTHAVGHSYRSHVAVEPYLSDQWYVKVTDDRLAGAALDAITKGQREDSEGPVWREGESFTNGDGGLTFFPSRYARTFQTWHENIRDWCISRQLWWGHRIPVWSRVGLPAQTYRPGEERTFLKTLLAFDAQDRLCFQGAGRRIESDLDVENLTGDPSYFACVHQADDEEVIEFLEANGFVQDADVLDTWFSSALWPISTMGWPDPSAFPNDIPEGNALLEAWNPSSTLCTAREIITLWVSRMTMFNLYFRGCLPFKHVFIHAMIQDGEGQKMSKSLGNGVDPLDIIHSHGADAMRFTLAGMSTNTQDVRLPVNVTCPHTDEPFEPKMVTNKAGYRVMAPVQSSPKDPTKKMVTSYGVASGEAAPTDKMPLARNSSSKFDSGRNFCNKLWNAMRFTISNLESQTAGEKGRTEQDRSLADRWILSRLAKTVATVNDAISGYQFNRYVECVYDFFWRDLCDWYLEAIKPVVREDDSAGHTARATIAACLDCVLRLLQPVTPFVTEKLFGRLNEVIAHRSIDGVRVDESGLCIDASWPDVDHGLVDEVIEGRFELMRELIVTVRNIRSKYNVPPRDVVDVMIRATGDDTTTIESNADLLATLANANLTAIGSDIEEPDNATSTTCGAIEIYITGLVDEEAERELLAKRQSELKKSIKALAGRLANRGYTDKAPAHLVQQTRDQLSEAEAELEKVSSKLA